MAASAVGTVVGNAAVNLGGNYIKGCNNRGKRSIFMHKLEKRQAIEGPEGKVVSDIVSIIYIASYFYGNTLFSSYNSTTTHI